MQEHGPRPLQSDPDHQTLDPQMQARKALTGIDRQRVYFLDRMSYLRGVKSQQDTTTPQEVTILTNRVISSTLEDCTKLGEEDRAKSILAGKETSYLGIIIFEPPKPPEQTP